MLITGIALLWAVTLWVGCSVARKLHNHQTYTLRRIEVMLGMIYLQLSGKTIGEANEEFLKYLHMEEAPPWRLGDF